MVSDTLKSGVTIKDNVLLTCTMAYLVGISIGTPMARQFQ